LTGFSSECYFRFSFQALLEFPPFLAVFFLSPFLTLVWSFRVSLVTWQGNSPCPPLSLSLGPSFFSQVFSNFFPFSSHNAFAHLKLSPPFRKVVCLNAQPRFPPKSPLTFSFFFLPPSQTQRGFFCKNSPTLSSSNSGTLFPHKLFSPKLTSPPPLLV